MLMFICFLFFFCVKLDAYFIYPESDQFIRQPGISLTLVFIRSAEGFLLSLSVAAKKYFQKPIRYFIR